MMDWHNVRADNVHVAVAHMLELSNTLNWTPSEFYIACRMITHFLERKFGCQWVDEEKFTETLSDFKAK